MNISYAITVKDEINEVKQLIGRLVTTLKSQDEIVVLWDDKGDIEIKKWIEEKFPFHVYLEPVTFNKDFSELKNKLNSLCKRDYIFQLDADEFPDERLLENIHTIIESNSECEAYWLPRENYVNGITENHLKAWGWTIDSKKRIQYPDWQLRIFKNDPTRIKWVGKLHEKIEGYKTIAYLPPSEEYSLYHYKDIVKQEQQNHTYTQII